MGVSLQSRRGRSGRRAPMAEINVTPLVDVMLVLLIIFMVTAPLLVAGVPVDLPQNRAAPLDQQVKPIQLSNFDFEGYLAARREFTSGEWIDLLVQSIGFNPELFGRRAKLIQLVRLIPFVATQPASDVAATTLPPGHIQNE